MTNEQFYTYQEQTFDSFCKKVIRNASVDIFREYARSLQNETSFSNLSARDFLSLATEDIYIPYQKIFTVCGYKIPVCDRALGEALKYIQPQQREVVLLYYFLGLSDTEIGVLLGIDYQVARLRRLRALKFLQGLLEESPYA